MDHSAWWSLRADGQGQPEDPAQDAQGLALEECPILSSLHAAHVGAVDSQYLGEGLLAESPLHAVGTKVPAHCLLEVTYSHASKSDLALLSSLQTYE